MKYIAVCPQCENTAGLNENETRICARCGDDITMLMTAIKTDEYALMNDTMKAAMIAIVKENPGANVTFKDVRERVHAENEVRSREKTLKMQQEQERRKQEQLEQEQNEKAYRDQQEREAQERLEQERLEQERLEQIRLEQERLEREHQEQERRQREADEKLKIAAGQIFNADMDAVDPKVANFLKNAAKRKLDNEKKYRDSVLIDCGFCHKESVVDSTGDRRNVSAKSVADDVTPEEFDLILKASGRNRKPEPVKVTSGAAVFFMVIAIVVWVFGLIISILMADAARSNEFAVFMENFLTYGMYGCLAFCASELFRRLAKIQSLLTSIRDRLKDDD